MLKMDLHKMPATTSTALAAFLPTSYDRARKLNLTALETRRPRGYSTIRMVLSPSQATDYFEDAETFNAVEVSRRLRMKPGTFAVDAREILGSRHSKFTLTLPLERLNAKEVRLKRKQKYLKTFKILPGKGLLDSNIPKVPLHFSKSTISHINHLDPGRSLALKLPRPARCRRDLKTRIQPLVNIANSHLDMERPTSPTFSRRLPERELSPEQVFLDLRPWYT
ncbi:hypothetical protein EDD85DRAFT_789504 [Armillaria nabsnona]|nr:hypothetical protein EDD85DRAFT_789504 [Armillaria nabsnona]